MAAVGVRAEDIDVLLLTHMYGGHIGGMFRDGKKAFPNADIVVSQKEYDYWPSVNEMNKLPEERRCNFVLAQKVFS